MKRGRILSFILVIFLTVQLFSGGVFQRSSFAQEITEPVTEQTKTEDAAIENTEATESAQTTEEILDEELQEETETQGDGFAFLTVSEDVILQEDMTVRGLRIDEEKTLDLNGYTLTVTESTVLSEGNIIFRGGKLIAQKDLSVSENAGIEMTDVNDHLLTYGDLVLTGDILFTNGIIEAKKDVVAGKSLQAGEKTTFLFTGEEKQTVQASDGSSFGNVILQNYSSDGLYIAGGFQYITFVQNDCHIEYLPVNPVPTVTTNTIG